MKLLPYNKINDKVYDIRAYIFIIFVCIVLTGATIVLPMFFALPKWIYLNIAGDFDAAALNKKIGFWGSKFFIGFCPLSVFNGEDTHAAGGTPIPPAAQNLRYRRRPRTCSTPRYRRQRNGRHHDGHKFQWPGLPSERNLRTWIAAVLKRRG